MSKESIKKRNLNKIICSIKLKKTALYNKNKAYLKLITMSFRIHDLIKSIMILNFQQSQKKYQRLK